VSAWQRGQATIEALVVVPLCVLAGTGLVDAGHLVSDRIAVQRAASAAAVAVVNGEGAAKTASAALPATLRPTVRTTTRDGRVDVSAASELFMLPGTIRLHASAETEAGEAS
jgi:Flp pilus assembly protein TadG